MIQPRPTYNHILCNWKVSPRRKIVGTLHIYLRHLDTHIQGSHMRGFPQDFPRSKTNKNYTISIYILKSRRHSNTKPSKVTIYGPKVS